MLVFAQLPDYKCNLCIQIFILLVDYWNNLLSKNNKYFINGYYVIVYYVDKFKLSLKV